jgi:exodeoxyribonuclease-1
MPATLLWYDLETFGLDSRWDRIAQFAALRTDDRFEPVGDRITLYCKPGPDYLPSPYSCLVHGITPQYALAEGLPDYEFAKRLRSEMGAPGSTVVGFNSLRFDDEFVRNLLYRNFFDPYEREWKNGNSRWDVIDLARAARDLRPEGIVWPSDDEGRPIFTLVALAKANGIAHAAAHDAMHDVLATVEVAKLIRARQPKLFEWYFSHRTRDSLKAVVDLVERSPLVHTSVGYTSTRGCTTLVAPVALDPADRNRLVAIDLRFDPGEVVELPVEELRRRVFSKAEELEEERLPLTGIRLNRCPFLAPIGTLSDAAAARLGLDVEACMRNLAKIKAEPELIQKLAAVFETPVPPEVSEDPDLRIYADGFFPDEDAEAFAAIHESIARLGPAAAKERLYKLKFLDERPPQMLRRFYARNFPETLGPAEASRWRAFCATRLQLPPAKDAADLSSYAKIVEQKLESPSTPARERGLLLALLEYKGSLEREVMGYEARPASSRKSPPRTP